MIREERLAMADKELADLQAQIDGLRAERQSILAEVTERSDMQERMNA